MDPDQPAESDDDSATDLSPLGPPRSGSPFEPVRIGAILGQNGLLSRFGRGTERNGHAVKSDQPGEAPDGELSPDAEPEPVSELTPDGELSADTEPEPASKPDADLSPESVDVVEPLAADDWLSDVEAAPVDTPEPADGDPATHPIAAATGVEAETAAGPAVEREMDASLDGEFDIDVETDVDVDPEPMVADRAEVDGVEDVDSEHEDVGPFEPGGHGLMSESQDAPGELDEPIELDEPDDSSGEPLSVAAVEPPLLESADGAVRLESADAETPLENDTALDEIEHDEIEHNDTAAADTLAGAADLGDIGLDDSGQEQTGFEASEARADEGADATVEEDVGSDDVETTVDDVDRLPVMEDLRAMAAELDEVDAILERLDSDQDALLADMDEPGDSPSLDAGEADNPEPLDGDPSQNLTTAE